MVIGQWSRGRGRGCTGSWGGSIGGSAGGCIVGHCPCLQLKPELLVDRAVARHVAGVACGVKAHHAFTFAITKSFLLMAKMVVEGFSRKGIIGIVGICPSGVDRRSAGWLAILSDRALPRVLIVVGALFNNSLETSFGKCVVPERDLLDNCLIFGE